MFDTHRVPDPGTLSRTERPLAGRLAGAPAAEKAEAVEQLDALRNAVHAAQLEVIAAIENDGDTSELGARKTATWLACKLGISTGEAREWVRVAIALKDLPHLSESYAKGEMPWEAIALLTKVATPTNETELLDASKDRSLREVEKLTRAVAGASLEATERQLERRFFRIRRDLQDGGWKVKGYLTSVQGEILTKSLERVMESDTPIRRPASTILTRSALPMLWPTWPR